MELKFTPKIILRLLALAWIIFSIIYISWGAWDNYKNVQLSGAYEQGYNQGRGDTIRQLVLEAEKCQAFSVFIDEKEIELIKTDCVGATQ